MLYESRYWLGRVMMRLGVAILPAPIRGNVRTILAIGHGIASKAPAVLSGDRYVIDVRITRSDS